MDVAIKMTAIDGLYGSERLATMPTGPGQYNTDLKYADEEETPTLGLL